MSLATIFLIQQIVETKSTSRVDAAGNGTVTSVPSTKDNSNVTNVSISGKYGNTQQIPNPLIALPLC